MKNFLVLQLKKVKNPIYIGIILILYWINDHIEIIKAEGLAIAICCILICLVLLKDTIYKCLDRICKRDETIEKEKTKRLLSKKDDDSSPDGDPSANKSSNTKNDDKDMKIYNIKNRKPS